MIDTARLRGIIAERKMSQAEIARYLGITQKTFYSKMARGIFDSNEMYQMKDLLGISNEDACNIFFAHNVT